MIRTRPEGKPTCIKPATTKAKSKTRKTLDKSGNDELSSPSKMKTSSNSSMKVKTPSPSKMKTSSNLSMEEKMQSPIKTETSSLKHISVINGTSQEVSTNIILRQIIISNLL